MESRSASTAWKKWLGRLLLVFVPSLLTFQLLEATCRGLGWGYPTSFFVPDTIGDQRVWRTNEFYGYRFFQPLMARSPATIFIARNKPPGLKRVAVLGESAAMGDPLIEFGLARALDKILNAPGEPRRYEVVNAGMTAISSPVIVDIATELARKDFDIFVVYMGNNEVVGPYGPDTVFRGSDIGGWFARLHVWWTRSRLASAISAWQSSSSPGKPWDGMVMFTGNRLAANDPRTEVVHRNYEKNVDRLVTMARGNGIETILCTVAVNLSDCPPIYSTHGRALDDEEAAAWQASFDKGASSLDAGRDAEAMEAFAEALRIDPDHAGLNYLAARAAEKYGNINDAARLYSQARDLDTLRVRTDSRMNDIVRRVSARHGTELLESADVFGPAPGAESFVDHVHFTLEGVTLLANAVASAIDPGAAKVDTETMAQRLDRNDWSERKLATIMMQRLENPPFTGQAGNNERLDLWRIQRERLTGEPDPGDAEQILTDLKIRESEYPWDSEIAVQSLHRLAGIGAWPEAAILADRIRPKLRGSSATNGLLALVYAQAGRPEDAADVLTDTGPPYGYFLVDAAFQLLGALEQEGQKNTGRAVAARVLKNAGEFPGRAALLRWVADNGA